MLRQRNADKGFVPSLSTVKTNHFAPKGWGSYREPCDVDMCPTNRGARCSDCRFKRPFEINGGRVKR